MNKTVHTQTKQVTLWSTTNDAKQEENGSVQRDSYLSFFINLSDKERETILRNAKALCQHPWPPRRLASAFPYQRRRDPVSLVAGARTTAWTPGPLLGWKCVISTRGGVNRRFLWILHWGICQWGNSLVKNYLQRNKYSKVCIAEHKHGHHDEMKTSTEYRSVNTG